MSTKDIRTTHVTYYTELARDSAVLRVAEPNLTQPLHGTFTFKVPRYEYNRLPDRVRDIIKQYASHVNRSWWLDTRPVTFQVHSDKLDLYYKALHQAYGKAYTQAHQPAKTQAQATSRGLAKAPSQDVQRAPEQTQGVKAPSEAQAQKRAQAQVHGIEIG